MSKNDKRDTIDILKKAEETMFSVSGTSCQKALEIQARLRLS